MMSGIRIPVIALAVTASALAVFDMAMSQSGAAIGTSITTAVDQRSAAAATPDQLAGFDPAHLHLSNLSAGLAGQARFAVGDRLSLSERDGTVHTYAIVDVGPLAVKSGEVEGNLARLAIVTAANVARPSQTLRFIVELGAAPLVPVSRPRAL